MRTKARLIIPIFAMGLVFGSAMEALAQRVTEPILRANPKRDIGGSCVYDRQGKLVFSPEGKYCRDKTDHLSKSARADSPIVGAYPPAMQKELKKLLGDHDHIAREITRLQRAVESRNQDIALEVVEKIRAELTDHRTREELFFAKVAPSRDAP